MKPVLAAVVCVVPVFMSTLGCATQDDFHRLEKRIAALEEKQQAKEAIDQGRQKKLEKCVTIDADEAYWGYIQLNGKPVAGKLGAYTAAQYHWAEAAKLKQQKMEECKLLYGPR